MTSKGAYGLVFDDLAALDPEMFVDADPAWLPWRISHTVLTVAELDEHRYRDEADGSSARLTSDPAGFVTIDRASQTSVLHLDHAPSLDELVHPGLATTGATSAWWRGQLALHGGAVSKDGSAIAFLADSEHGKSSTLAWLIAQGWGAVSDDLLVIDGAAVLAGPRIVDLRQETALRWGLGSYVGVVGTRERWRVRTSQVAARSPLAALVVLEWGETVELSRVDPAQRVATLLRYRALDLEPHPMALFRLLPVPVYVLRRPRDISGLEDSLRLLLDAVGLGAPSLRGGQPGGL